jgi:hypothetical protein
MPANGLYRFVDHVIKGRRTLPIAAPFHKSRPPRLRAPKSARQFEELRIELDISIRFSAESI